MPTFAVDEFNSFAQLELREWLSPQDVRYEYEDRLRALMDRLFAWYDAGQIKPVAGSLYPLERFQDAMADVLGRKSLGRTAIVMGEEAKRHGFET